MKNFRGFALGLVLGIGVALSGLAFAQTTNEPNKKAESCCAMESCCCCHGDSCPMKDAKDKSGQHECCCCGDSCDMKDAKHMTEMKEKP